MIGEASQASDREAVRERFLQELRALLKIANTNAQRRNISEKRRKEWVMIADQLSRVIWTRLEEREKDTSRRTHERKTVHARKR